MKRALFNITVWLLLFILVWINIIVLGFGGITLEGFLVVAYTLLLVIAMYYYLYRDNIQYLLYWSFLSIVVIISTLFFEDVDLLALIFIIPIGYMIYYVFDLKSTR